MSFVISLIIFIAFSTIGGLISVKIPKIDLHIPEPIISIVAFGMMCAEFYYANDRSFQIILSLLIGMAFCYLLNCSNNK